MWQYVAGQAASAVLENMLSGRKQMARLEAETAKIANKVSAANADSANKLRTSANVLTAAQARLPAGNRVLTTSAPCAAAVWPLRRLP